MIAVAVTDLALRVNGVTLRGCMAGEGEPVVLVHGAFTDQQAWRFVGPELATTNRVVTYDRRGHSLSGGSRHGATRATEENDLVELIEALGLGSVHLVGSSYGASIVLGVAARRPDLVRSVVAHEPALLDLVEDGRIEPVRRAFEALGRRIAAGDSEAAVASFVDDLILGPGWWAQLPELSRTTMVANSVTIPGMLADPRWADLDVAALAATGVPVLLTAGSASPGWFRTTTFAVARLVPGARTRTYDGAGHMPHITHPDALVAAVRAFATRAVAA